MKLLINSLLVLIFTAPLLAQDSMEIAHTAYSAGNFETVIKTLSADKNLLKISAEANNILGLAYLKQAKNSKDFENAKKAFNRAITLDSTNEEYRLNQAITFFWLGNPKEAGNASEKAIEINPKSSTGYYFLGKSYFQRYEFDKGLKEVLHAIDLQPGTARYYLEAGNAVLISYLLESRKYKNSDAQNQLPLLSKLLSSIELLERCDKNCLKQDAGPALSEMKGVYQRFYARRKDRIEKIGTDEDADIDTDSVHTGDKVNKPVRIIKYHYPKYTEEARDRSVSGKVTLAAILKPDGTVGDIYVISGLIGGLTESSISALKKVEFEPEISEGKKVATLKLFTYGFSIN
ncbi:MAG: energy transducer TonB [Pyrinomonadaceae bacterium]